MDQNCDNNYQEKKLKRLDRQPSCREAVKIAQKQFFKEEKNTNMNAIKHATQ